MLLDNYQELLSESRTLRSQYLNQKDHVEMFKIPLVPKVTIIPKITKNGKRDRLKISDKIAIPKIPVKTSYINEPSLKPLEPLKKVSTEKQFNDVVNKLSNVMSGITNPFNDLIASLSKTIKELGRSLINLFALIFDWEKIANIMRTVMLPLAVKAYKIYKLVSSPMEWVIDKFKKNMIPHVIDLGKSLLYLFRNFIHRIKILIFKVTNIIYETGLFIFKRTVDTAMYGLHSLSEKYMPFDNSKTFKTSLLMMMILFVMFGYHLSVLSKVFTIKYSSF